MHRALLRSLCIFAVLIALFGLVSCGGSQPAPFNGAATLGQVSVSVSPQNMSVPTGTVQAFTATINNSGVSGVQWQVNGFTGGGGNTGTIDKSGNYTAPQFIPNPPTVTITAVSNADNTRSGSTTVTITGAQVPAQVTISPTLAYLQVGTSLTLSAGVTGPADTGVIWQVVDNGTGVVNGNSTVGTIAPGSNGSAVYKAPTTVPSGGTATIRAVSHAQPNVFATCIVNISLNPPNIATVTISPLTAAVQAGSSFTFTADVIGVTNTAVTWEVNGTAGGDPLNGTISQTGIYTAPSTIPPLPVPYTVTVTAVSQAQPSKSASATVTLIPANPLSVGITISPTSVPSLDTGSAVTFTATVSNATDQTVTWKVNGITGGNGTYGTITTQQGTTNIAQYIAPTTVPSQNPVIISAVPNAAPNLSANASVTITQSTVTVTVTPSSSLVEVGQTQDFQAAVTGTGGSDGVNWYVNGILGGNPTVGTITNTGANTTTYTAPASVPNPAAVQIKATSTFDSSASGTASVTITAMPVITISPPSANVEATTSINLSASVTGIANPSLIWSVNGEQGGDPTIGTVSLLDTTTLNAQYLAPATVPTPNTVNITAQDQNTLVTSNTAVMTITPFVQEVTITVNPTSADVMPGQQQQFSATVNNSADQIVNWSLSGPAGGCNATICGTITLQTNGDPATYTAPQTIPPDPNITVTATADAAPNPQATAAVTIAILPASISISPADPTVQAGSTSVTTFVATVENVDPSTTEVTWTLGCNSEAPDIGGGENCRSFIGDGAGPGCLSDGLGNDTCAAGSFSDLATVDLSYTPPKILGTNFEENACTTTAGSNGLVPLTAQFTASNCTGGVCAATVCITVTPP